MRVAVAAGFAPSLIVFRGPLLRALVAQGHGVTTSAAEEDRNVAATLRSWGGEYRPLPLARVGLNPWRDYHYLQALRSWLGNMEADVVIAYTHKPVIYAGLAAGALPNRPRVYPLITGLGFAFIGGGLKARLAQFVLRLLYRGASRNFTGVFFQNSDDHTLFRRLGLIRPETPVCIVRGSGIDLEEFPYLPFGELTEPERPKAVNLRGPVGEPDTETLAQPPSERTLLASGLELPLSAFVSQSFPIHFLLIARLLGDKGIREYVAAAKEVKKMFPETVFSLVGPTDPNPAAIPMAEIEGWQRDGVITYYGARVGVRPFLRDCTTYVLPSYREGTPRTVLEAMASGRAVITTDAPGCRETIFNAGPADGEGVRTGENGMLVRVKSVESLASAMLRFIKAPSLAISMGRAGRRLAEEHYDVHKVNRKMLEFMGLAAPTDPMVP